MSLVCKLLGIFRRKETEPEPEYDGPTIMREIVQADEAHVKVGRLELISKEWDQTDILGRWPVVGCGTEVFFDGVKQDGVRKIVLTIEYDSIVVVDMERYA